MQNLIEYSFKLTEIWLIDKDINGQSLKPNLYDIWDSGKILWVPNDPSGLLHKVYGLGQTGLKAYILHLNSYHANWNGIVEKFHGSIKPIIY